MAKDYELTKAQPGAIEKPGSDDGRIAGSPAGVLGDEEKGGWLVKGDVSFDRGGFVGCPVGTESKIKMSGSKGRISAMKAYVR